MSKNVLMLVIVLTVAATALWLVSQKPASYNQTGTQTLSSEQSSLDSVDLDSIDSDLNNVDSESSTF